MYLHVFPNGSKYWRMDYSYHGKTKTLALGVYPLVSLAEAREKRYEAKKLLSAGIDPSYQRKLDKMEEKVRHENSFEAVAREWHRVRSPEWTKKHATATLNRFERDIFPEIGFRPISELTAQELLVALRKVEDRGAIELAHRLRQNCGQVFRYAISSGLAERDIARDLEGALQTRKAVNLKFLKETELPEFFEALEGYWGEPETTLAMKLLVLTFVRSGELRGARWEEFDTRKAEWEIPAERMKMKRPHVVPLSRQSLAIIEKAREINGKHAFVFPATNNPRKHMAENTMMYAMYKLGYRSRATMHGFRSTASTILNEHQFPPDVIEKQLAHEDRNKVRGIYNHAQYLPERREMMQWYADHLERLGLCV